MAYCRWSSDNWRSNVYVYEGNGWIVHVAIFKRLIPPIPELPITIMGLAGGRLNEDMTGVIYPTRAHRVLGWALGKLWLASHNLTMLCLKVIPRVPIKSPHAGETYVCSDPAACASLLLDLRDEGLHVPARAIDILLEEACG